MPTKNFLLFAAAAASLVAIVAFKAPRPRPAINVEDLSVSNILGYETIARFENHRRLVHFSPGATQIGVVLNDRATPSSPWYKTSTELSTSFEITGIGATDGGQVLYVAGVRDGGSDVLERWTFPTVDGVWFAEPGPYLPIPMTSSIRGGQFVPPTSRSRNPLNPQRQLIWRGHDFGGIRDVAADPEGRYAYVLTDSDGELLRLDLSHPGSSPVVALTPAMCPPLADMHSLELRNHDTEGRKFVLSRIRAGRTQSGSHPVWLVLDDGDNDGIIDGHSSYTYQQFITAFETDDWIDLNGDGLVASQNFPQSDNGN